MKPGRWLRWLWSLVCYEPPPALDLLREINRARRKGRHAEAEAMTEALEALDRKYGYESKLVKWPRREVVA